MKHLRLSLLAVAAMMAALLHAQTNVLRIDTVKAPSGKALSLNVAMENASDVTGVQFDISVPYELATDGEGVVITEAARSRIPNHTLACRKKDTPWKSYYPNGEGTSGEGMTYHRYRVIIYSDRNELVVDDRGTLLTLQLTTDVALKNNALLPVYLENVTMTSLQKQNVATGAKNGAIVIEQIPRPDLEPSEVTFTPASIKPGGVVTVSWQVKNVGMKATEDGWTEQISLVNLSGTTSKLIGTTYYDQILSQDGVVSRQADIELPQNLGLDGLCKVKVEVVPTEKTGEHPTMRDNNIAMSATNISIEKQLTLELSKLRFTEGTQQRVMAKLSRSGSWTMAQTFHIALAPEDSRVDIQHTVTIPAGQSGVVFYFNVLDNDVVDADSLVNITVSHAEYTSVSQQIVIEDNEYPALIVTPSSTTLTEGDEFTLTIALPKIATEPVTVKVASEDNVRFQFNSTAVIPAGELSVTVPVKCVDDEQPHLEQANKFTVSALRYSPAETIVILQDNDTPALTLELTPNTVSEGAGPNAVSAVLKRSGKTNNKITVKISDDSNGGLYYSNKSIVMEKGVESVFFNLGPVENTLQEGDRTYTMRAAIWISSCSCAASTGQSAGYVESQLTVLDNDGAALSISSEASTVKEGGETTVTVKRNTVNDVSQPLTVTLSSNYDADLEYQKSVTIPAGEVSADVVVKSKKNDVSGDSHTVIFTVSAPGYASGTCVLMVTDQTLPDARIEDITTDIKEGIVGTPFTLSVTLKNDGAYPLPANTRIDIYKKGTANAIVSAYTDDPLPVGSTVVVSRTLTSLEKVGDHVFYAVVNPTRAVSELIYTNNTSAEVTVKGITPFTAQVQTDKQVYRQGDMVVISGQLTGEQTDSTTIDVYMINEGARQVKQVKTTADGKFTLEWPLYKKQLGHFVVGACFMDDPTTEEQATFDVYGLKRVDNGHITCDVTCGETYRGYVSLVNSGSLPLSGVRTELIGVPAGCDAQFEIQENIAGGETVNLVYAFTGSLPTEGNNWEMLRMRVISAEGADLEVPFHYYARLAKANLVVDNNNLITTMNKTNGRDYTFKVSNIGKGNSGKLSLSLPEWMTPLTGATMAALNQNDTATIVLRMMPTDDMQLNVPVTGMFGINCENGNGTFVNFNITPVSEETGTLAIEVCDEYTYYTEEHPRVKDAQIVLRNPVTGALVAQGTSDEKGQWSMVLPEGYYQVNVTADNHDSYRNNILIDPGTTNTEVVNLSYQAITVSWDVEETEVEDEYTIVTTVKYETNVPMPVVETVSPDELMVDELAEGESVVFYTILTNRGLINALNVRYTVPEYFAGCSWEPLVQNTGLTLAPQQSYTIPVMVTKLKAEEGARPRRASGGDDCTMVDETYYEWDCGTDHKMHYYKKSRPVKHCKGDPSPGGYQEQGSDPPAPNGNGSDKIFEHESNGVKVSGSDYCSPCLTNLDNLMGDVIDCGLGFAAAATTAIPVVGQVVGAIGGIWASGRTAWCLKNVDPKSKNAHLDNTLCSIGGLNTILGVIPGGGVPAAWIGCGLAAIDIGRGCGAPSGAKSLNGRMNSNYSSLPQAPPPPPRWLVLYRERMEYAEKYLNTKVAFIDEFYGDSVWKERATVSELQDLFMGLHNAIVADTLSADGLRLYKPMNISNEQFNTFIERISNSVAGVESDNKIDFDKLSGYLDKFDEYDQIARDMEQGYADISDMVQKELTKLNKHLEEDRGSVCSSISLQIDQTMTMTRQAFRGTLTIENGSEGGALNLVKLKLNVTNRKTGTVATEREFEMHTESLKMFEGDLDMESGWHLGTDSTGVATILFIPTKYAAPDEPVEYSFGGTLSYYDPYTLLEVSRELSPVTLTVKPSPELDLTYFMQRDLYGDDPLTDAVEPVVPGEFAVIINNKGNGDATNVRMVTKQPQIIENEKGLFIDFEFVSSQLNGQEKTMAMGESIPTEFGNIPAHTQAYAQWWLQSSLLGHFVDYDIKATHVSSYGNETLSLLDQVTIHELIHGFTPPVATNGSPSATVSDGSAVGRAFLVNDIEDVEELPDHIYFTDATQQEVSPALDAFVTKQSNTEYTLTISAYKAGWNYGSLLDPTAGRRKLLSIKRQRDGVELPVDNMWQTDRTLVDGQEWRYEKRLHFIADLPESTLENLTYGDVFLLTFEDRSEVELEVKRISGMEYESSTPVRITPVDEVTVEFNKAIKPETFTADDVTLTVQGQKQDLSTVQFSTEDNMSFNLDFTALNRQLGNGFYVLTVQTSGITDHEGYPGYTGKKVDWVQFIGGLIQFVTEAWPANSGTIEREVIDVPEGIRAKAQGGNVNSEQYGSTIRLTAIPAEGYDFVNWTIGGAVVSTNPVYEAKAVADAYIVANFKKKQYRLEVTANGNGTIVGNGTGLYDYDTELQIIAQPDEGYSLGSWKVDGETVSETGDTLRINFTKNTNVEATFVRSIYTQTITFAHGWNWFSTYLLEEQSLGDMTKYVSRMLSQDDEPVSNPDYGLEGSIGKIASTKAYKMDAVMTFTANFSGHLFNTAEGISLKQGWNWVAYPQSERAALTVIANAEEGDFLISQEGFCEYGDGVWTGDLTELAPGSGYLYKSVSDKQLHFGEAAGARRVLASLSSLNPSGYSVSDLSHRYPSTMNITARICRDGVELPGQQYTVYAMAGDELRGISRFVESNHYLTVYGDEPVQIRFVVELAETGETFDAAEKLMFVTDVVGNRREPYIVDIGTLSGISQVSADMPMTVYTLEGVLVSRDATIKTLRTLPKGVYIVNGRKVVVKR